jgi:ribose transport system permease protein
MLGTGDVAGFPNASILLLVVVAICYIVMERMWIGRQMYAVGGNERASYLSGIRVRRVVLFSYAMSSLLAAVGGMMLLCRTMGAEPLGGMRLLTLGIAAMFIGQTVFRVGQANVLGTLVGGLFVTTMGNGFTLLNVPFYYEYILWGVVVIAAMAFSGGHESP